jgi:SOS response regulatory protein OraA/RecX
MTEPIANEPAAPVRWIHGAPLADELGLSDSAPGSIGTSPRSAAEEAGGAPAPFAPIEDHALRALGRRGLSRRELGRRLEQAGYEADVIETELDRLEGTGLLDDFALAQNLVVSLQERKGLGRSAIAAELAKRVVAPAAISYALDLVDDGEELDRARDLASKRARSLVGLDQVTATRRLSAYLMRRGFSGSAVRAAVESVRSA